MKSHPKYSYLPHHHIYHICHIEESNGNKSKEILKKYEELWNKVRDLIRSITNNPGNYDEKYAKVKFKSHDDLLLKKTLEL